MKQLAKSLVIAGALAVAGSAVAEFGDLTPYAGVDFQQSWMKVAKGLNQSSYAKSFPGATVYLGTKFHENFGVEAGYSQSLAKKKTDSANNLKTKLTRSTAFVDLVGFLPVMDCVELIGSVGYGFQMPKLTQTVISADSSTKVKFKNKGAVRVGLGASYMLTDMVGLRAKLGWENTASIKQKDSTVKPFKNTANVSVGAFVKF